MVRVARWSGERGWAASAAHRVTGAYLYNNPLAYLDILRAFIEAGEPHEAVFLYESVRPPIATAIISDTIAFALLDDGGPDAASQILSLRPFDLYANYHLWLRYTRVERPEAAALHADRLSYFPQQAVLPLYEPLFSPVLLLIPDLVSEEFWSYETAWAVLDSVVWTAADAPSVESALIRLTERYPEEPAWAFMLAESYHRAGELDQAVMGYRRVLEMEEAPPLTYLRLGAVYEALAGVDGGPYSLQQAVERYADYFYLVPEDLLGLQSLGRACAALDTAGVVDAHCAEVSQQLGGVSGQVADSPATVLSAALAHLTDNQRVAADLLGIPAEDLTLGPNLIQNAGFESSQREPLPRWVWSDMSNRAPFNAGCFVGGADSLAPFEGRQSARVNGLWVQQEAGKSHARAGFWQRFDLLESGQPITLTTGMPYLISLDYRTTGLSAPAMATLWMSESPDVLWGSQDYTLPSTNGSWYHVVVVGWNRAEEDVAVRPLVRLFGVGQVEFDDMQLRPLDMVDAGSLEPTDPLFYISQGIRP
jgi:tetratricopeptide (TPR) repeat protein